MAGWLWQRRQKGSIGSLQALAVRTPITHASLLLTIETIVVDSPALQNSPSSLGSSSGSSGLNTPSQNAFRFLPFLNDISPELLKNSSLKFVCNSPNLYNLNQPPRILGTSQFTLIKRALSFSPESVPRARTEACAETLRRFLSDI